MVKLPISGLLSGLFVAQAWAGSPVDFNEEIRPILSNRCFRCHGPDGAERKAGLRLDRRERALKDLGGYAAIVPGKPGESRLLGRISSRDPEEVMPPPRAGERLAESEVALLERWIAEGAPYARHWAYVRPGQIPPPEVGDESWVRHGLDRFILRRLESEGLAPSPEAERYALARRVALDLTGLPPTMEEVERFVQSDRPQAYEELVDGLLSKKAFGEHWARHWLDLARYADSAGYADDPPRTIWAFRDYVIRSFNENKRLDQFTWEQLAGDLFPDPTQEQLIATAFHRNTQTNNEGGTNDEEYRNVAVVDRVNTTFAVWMGTTMACAQCHTHKYDPITQREYFQVFAIFNTSADADRRDESPLIGVSTPEFEAAKLAKESELGLLERSLSEPDSERRLFEHFAGSDPSLKERRTAVKALREELAEMKPPTTVPIMRELKAGERRKTRIQVRGSYLNQGDLVEPGLPSDLHRAPEGVQDRLALADWLMDPENPLPARVAANRLWEAIFGVGLVRTSEEFGSQGELPSHPELLDYLANRFVSSGWNIKGFLKDLVSSAAYRQSSRVTPELLERDPDNRLLARGPRLRLSAEMVRDQALCVSALLSEKMYGPPVKPRQPKIGLNAAFGSGIDWKTSEGEDQYRRGLYTTWRRSNPYPSMAAFDAPNREVCTVRRAITNTPLQALVTLNDPVYMEAAQSLARVLLALGKSPGETADAAYRRCLLRPAKARERRAVVELYHRTKARLVEEPERARQLATDPLGPLPEDTDLASLAAWSVVSNVILNLDEIFLKP